jgi:DNA (cytosine-5)-methyltransferase 1
VREIHELALFAGGGGGILGGILLGWRTVCAVELDPYCRSVLLARQRDGLLPRFPIWDDVRTFDGRTWRGHIDIITGGFPCQDISSAGPRTGLAGSRSGLWSEFARIIGEIRPPMVLVENSPHLRTRGLTTVIRDLARLGYDARWGVLGARHVGAPHRRYRMWIVAQSAGDGWTCSLRGEERPDREATDEASDSGMARLAQSSGQRCGQGRARRLAPGMAGQQQLPFLASDSDCCSVRQHQGGGSGEGGRGSPIAGGTPWWPVDLIQGVDDGLGHRVDRVRATGNGQVPGVVALAWEILSGGELEKVRERPEVTK